MIEQLWALVTTTVTRQGVPVTCSDWPTVVRDVCLALVPSISAVLTAWIALRMKQLQQTADIVQKQTDRRSKPRT